MKEIYFYDEIYLNNYFFYVGSPKQVEPRLKKSFPNCITEGWYCADGRQWSIPGYGYVIWMPKFSRNPKDMGILVHELMHCFVESMIESNIKFCVDHDEPLAYYFQYLVRKFLEEWKK